jgi:arabinogalactan oligomer/maltooligosaccharide transport system substrate-binding protein
MKKKFLAAMMAAALSVTMLAGCGSGGDSTSSDGSQTTSAGDTSSDSSDSGEKETVTLTLWGAEEDQDLLKEMVESFKTEYADKADFDISVGVESESSAKDTILKDVEAAADVFAFADDQINTLVAAKALQPVDIDTDAIIEANGGADSGSVQAATQDGTLYAYPMTADNGYFMFYNKEYFTEDDVQTLDKMLDIAAENGKQVSMQLNEGWYLYSFFQAAGLTVGLEDDGTTNYCTWNATDGTYKGTDVAQAILDITANKGFISVDDAAFVSGLQDGTIIAGVSGTWNAETAETVWGDNYAACKLPTFTLAGDQVQMASFAGYKMVGVNPYSEYTGYAELLAEWITNYDNQVLRFEKRGLGPSNVEAASSEEVQASPAIAALAAQAQYATVQRVGDNYWAPVETFGAIMAAGNKDKTDLQELLDTMVEGIVAPIE